MRIDARAFSTVGLGFGALEFAAIGLLVITPSMLPRYEASVPAFDFSDAVPRKSFGDKVPFQALSDTAAFQALSDKVPFQTLSDIL